MMEYFCDNFWMVSPLWSPPPSLSLQQQIIQGIESLCNDLGPSLGPQCQQYVSEYGPLVINFLLQYLVSRHWSRTSIISKLSLAERWPTTTVGRSSESAQKKQSFSQCITKQLDARRNM